MVYRLAQNWLIGTGLGMLSGHLGKSSDGQKGHFHATLQNNDGLVLAQKPCQGMVKCGLVFNV